MIKMSVPNRIILLITGHLSGYMIVAGIEGYDVWTTFFYTVAYGVLLLSCLLMMLFGFEILDNIFVVAVTTLIPLSLSMGIISNFLPRFEIAYLVFSIAGLILILITRIYQTGKIPTIVLTVVHGLAGMVIFILPISLSLSGVVSAWFALVGVGGALIGLTGMALAFIKMGTSIIPKELIYKIFPKLLLVMTIMFVVGMSL